MCFTCEVRFLFFSNFVTNVKVGECDRVEGNACVLLE